MSFWDNLKSLVWLGSRENSRNEEQSQASSPEIDFSNITKAEPNIDISVTRENESLPPIDLNFTREPQNNAVDFPDIQIENSQLLEWNTTENTGIELPTLGWDETEPQANTWLPPLPELGSLELPKIDLTSTNRTPMSENELSELKPIGIANDDIAPTLLNESLIEKADSPMMLEQAWDYLKYRDWRIADWVKDFVESEKFIYDAKREAGVLFLPNEEQSIYIEQQLQSKGRTQDVLDEALKDSWYKKRWKPADSIGIDERNTVKTLWETTWQFRQKVALENESVGVKKRAIRADEFNRQNIYVWDEEVDTIVENTKKRVFDNEDLYSWLSLPRRMAAQSESQKFIWDAMHDHTVMVKEMWDKVRTLLMEWKNEQAQRIQQMMEVNRNNTEAFWRNLTDTVLPLYAKYQRQGYSGAESQILMEEELQEQGTTLSAELSKWMTYADGAYAASVIWLRKSGAGYNMSPWIINKVNSVEAEFAFNNATDTRSKSQKVFAAVTNFMQAIEQPISDSALELQDFVTNTLQMRRRRARRISEWESTNLIPVGDFSFARSDVSQVETLNYGEEADWPLSIIWDFAVWLKGITAETAVILGSWRALDKWLQATKFTTNPAKLWDYLDKAMRGSSSIATAMKNGLNPKVMSALNKLSIAGVRTMEITKRLALKTIPEELAIEWLIMGMEPNTNSAAQLEWGLLWVGLWVIVDATRAGSVIIPWWVFNDITELVGPAIASRYWDTMSDSDILTLSNSLKDIQKAYSNKVIELEGKAVTDPAAKERLNALLAEWKKAYANARIQNIFEWLDEGATATEDVTREILNLMAEAQDPRFNLSDVLKLDLWIKSDAAIHTLISNVRDMTKAEIQQFSAENLKYAYEELVSDVFKLDNKRFDPENVYTRNELEQILSNAEKRWVYSDLLAGWDEGSLFKYFDQTNDWFILNKNGMSRFDIIDNTTGIERMAKDVDSDNFYKVASETDSIPPAALKRLQDAKGFEYVESFFKNITNC